MSMKGQCLAIGRVLGVIGASLALGTAAQAKSASDVLSNDFNVSRDLTSLSDTVSPARAEPVLVAQQAAGSQYGIASWYGPGFAGRRSASGEIFDPNQLTAAHRTLPFGTVVRVTNVNNGRSVVVRINDRGPYVGNRIIDLSAAAANAIGIINSGVGQVQMQILR